MTGASEQHWTKSPRRVLATLVYFSVIVAVVGGGIFLLARFDPVVDANNGNPRSEPMKASERRAQQAANTIENQQRTALADEVARGTMSFEQAGCEHRGGEWLRDAQECAAPVNQAGVQ